jgi:succinyl-diaminopimelate desuccinylase
MSAPSPLDPVTLTQELIRCPSVTPDAKGTFEVLEHHLATLGFTCERLIFDEAGSAPVENLYARLGTTAPHLCFAGHVDVVPAGDEAAWRTDPFAGEIHDQVLYGRGAVDMKGGIAAFLCATAKYLEETKLDGSISFLITADEEGVAINGTRKVLEVLAERGEKIDFCLVGEPSSYEKVGDTIKIGRRGSLNTVLTIHGTQGHVAYPERADNPIPRLLQCLTLINQGPAEKDNPFFTATNVEITSIDVGNPTVNIIPAQATARFNIRFSDFQTGSSLQAWIKEICQHHGGLHTLEFTLSGEAEYLQPEKNTELLAAAILEVTSLSPELTTAGGTSDARFIRHYAPVLEFGLVGRTMHQVNECVNCDDLITLCDIYHHFLQRYFP